MATSYFASHSNSWLCTTIPSLATKGSVVQKTSTGQSLPWSQGQTGGHTDSDPNIPPPPMLHYCGIKMGCTLRNHWSIWLWMDLLFLNKKPNWSKTYAWRGYLTSQQTLLRQVRGSCCSTFCHHGTFCHQMWQNVQWCQWDGDKSCSFVLFNLVILVHVILW